MNKFKKIVTFLLSLIIVFSAFPTTVFAENTVDECTIFYYVNDTTISDYKSGTLPLNYSLPTISGYNSYNLEFVIHPVGSASDEGSLSVSFDISLPNGCNYGKLSSQCLLSKNNSVVETVQGKVNANNNIYSVTFSFSDKYEIAQVSLSFDNVTFTGSKTVGCKSATYEVTSVGGLLNKIVSFFGDLFNRLTSWFDSLFQWLKDIRDGNISFAESVKTLFSNITDNIRNFFSELGKKLSDGFSNLTSSIKGFFTDLGNNLKQWFANIGQWFKEIGDRIGSFFTNLWNNISDSISNITITVSNWWQSVVDFFHSLFVPEDGYFDSYKLNWENWAKAHFGLFFDVEELVNMMMNIFQGDALEPSITIPEVKLPFFNNPVIIPQTSFKFSSLLNQHTMIKYIYNLYKIGFSAIVYSLLLVYLQKTFSKIITDDEEAL